MGAQLTAIIFSHMQATISLTVGCLSVGPSVGPPVGPLLRWLVHHIVEIFAKKTI